MLVSICGSDPEERETFAFALRQAGLRTQPRARLAEVTGGWAQYAADLILALEPGEKELLDAIAELRQITTAPIIAVLDAPTQKTVLSAVRAGCDLVLTMPVDPRLAAAYSLNLARRSASVPARALPSLEVRGLRIDPAERTASVDDGEPVQLTQLEFRLLYSLVTHRGHVVSTDDLVEHVWGYAETGSADLVRGLISRLRAKLGDPVEEQRFIQTLPGVGYRMRADSA